MKPKPNQILIKDIRKQLIEYFSSRGDFDFAKPTGLANPNIPVAYNPSAGFLEIKDYVCADKKMPFKKFYINEKSFRNVDSAVVGMSNRHLSFFEMFAFFFAGPDNLIAQQKTEEELIKTTTDLLFNKFCLPKEKIVVTLFGGGSLANIDQISTEKNLIPLWMKYGILETNIIPTNGLRNFVANYQWGYAGASYEIFYKIDDDLLEIASTNKYKYWVKEETIKNKNYYVLSLSPNFVYGTGFGLERLSLILNRKNHIFDIPDLLEPLKLLRSFIPSELKTISKLDDEHLEQILNGIRSIVFIMSEDVQPSGNRSREKILKNIIKNTLEELNYLGLHSKSFEIIKETAKMIDRNYRDYYELKIDDTLSFLKNYLNSVDIKKKYSHLMQSE